MGEGRGSRRQAGGEIPGGSAHCGNPTVGYADRRWQGHGLPRQSEGFFQVSPGITKRIYKTWIAVSRDLMRDSTKPGSVSATYNGPLPSTANEDMAAPTTNARCRSALCIKLANNPP